LQGQDRIGVGEIDPTDQPAPAGADFPARGGIAHEYARPRRRPVQARNAAGIGLAGEFAHAVLVPNGRIGEGESPGETGVEFRLGDFATAALEAAGFHQPASTGQAQRREIGPGIDQVDEAERGAAKGDGAARLIWTRSAFRGTVPVRAAPDEPKAGAGGTGRLLPETEHGAERGAGRFRR
jgi:hypothetical protein